MSDTILVREFEAADRQAVQARAIASAREYREWHLSIYCKLADSFEGRYVAADLFKETFADYGRDRYSRNRYNACVHNAAATLSAAQLAQVMREPVDATRQKVVFLTGIPGAGKTSSILVGADGGKKSFPANTNAIFEGQLVNAEPTLKKIQFALDLGLVPSIEVVHTLPETALENVMKRFERVGRGASIDLMARIQSGTPGGLAQVRSTFGDQVALTIYDLREPGIVRKLRGWDNVKVLESEGSYERIGDRLRTALATAWARDRCSESAYEQFYGRVGPDSRGMGSQADRGHGTDGGRSGVPSQDRSSAVVKQGGRDR